MIAKKLKKQFKKDSTGLLGLMVLALVFVVALLGANIRPDSSKNANEQHPEIARLPPGTTVQFIVEDPGEANGFLQRLVFGGDGTSKAIPVDTLWQKNDTTYFYRLTTNGPLAKQDYLVGKFPQENRTYWLGTDKLGRDMLSRLMAGSTVSLSVGIISVAISLVIGIIIGASAGYFGGWIDNALMWFVNVIWSIPTLLMVMAITLALGKGFVQVFIAVGLTMWVEVARVTRGKFIEIKQNDYILAAQLLNTPTHKILFREMLPNAVGPLIVIAAGNFSTAILLEAGLSFLGIGAQVPMPSWGGMIKNHFAYLTTDAAFLALVPGVAIMVLVLSFIWLGNTLRDAFDVRG